jgi:hypothetical protein
MGLGYFISTSAILISAISYFLFLYFYLLLEFYFFNYFFITAIKDILDVVEVFCQIFKIWNVFYNFIIGVIVI